MDAIYKVFRYFRCLFLKIMDGKENVKKELDILRFFKKVVPFEFRKHFYEFKSIIKMEKFSSKFCYNFNSSSFLT